MALIEQKLEREIIRTGNLKTVAANQTRAFEPPQEGKIAA
jgi:hypothetical protein